MTTRVSSVESIPKAPPNRTGNIRSVFPKEMTLRFNQSGDTFTGAYMDVSGTVYAVSGNAVDPLADKGQHKAAEHHLESIQTFASAMTMPGSVDPLADKGQHKAAEHHLESIQTFASAMTMPSSVSIPPEEVAKVQFQSSTNKVPENPTLTKQAANWSLSPQFSSQAKGPATLSPNVLANLNPVIAGKDGNFSDLVSDLAMSDFRSIIIYYMDTDLRETFLGKSMPSIDAGVKAIADDSTHNSSFYKKLQTPFLVSMLANSEFDVSNKLRRQR